MTEQNYQEVECKQCKFVFKLYDNVKQDYLERGLQPPVRCKRCRDENRMKKFISEEIARQLGKVE